MNVPYRLNELRGDEDAPEPRYPWLSTHLTSGAVYVDGSAYIGRAGDGTDVQIGNVGRERDTEAYLAAHPSPQEW
jgi:hypothetical protein